MPWNKGLKHSEETKRKISEATRRAMLKPQMRQMLKERAKGRKHSEATKLKIRETARAARGFAKQKRKPKRTPVPFEFTPHVVAQLNERVQSTLDTEFQKASDDPDKLIVREKGPMPVKTREKLSQRIREMWNDPSYRMRVAEGIEQRQLRLACLNQESEPRKFGSLEKRRLERDGFGGKSPKRRARTLKPMEQILRVTVNTATAETSNAIKNEEEPEGDTLAQEMDGFEERDVDEVCDEDNDEGDTYRARVNGDTAFLDFGSLDGLSKEDLGIFGSHGAGKVESGIEGSLGQGEGEVEREGRSRSISGSSSKKETGDVWASTDDLLKSLRDAGQLPPLDGEPFVGSIPGGSSPFESVTPSLDTMDLREPGMGPYDHMRERWNDRDDELGFLGVPVDLLSPSTADISSPFFSVASTIEDDRITENRSDALDSKGGGDLTGNSGGDDFLSDKFSLHFVDDNFGDLGIYDDVGQSLDPIVKSSFVVGRDDQHSSDFAKTSKKSLQ